VPLTWAESTWTAICRVGPRDAGTRKCTYRGNWRRRRRRRRRWRCWRYTPPAAPIKLDSDIHITISTRTTMFPRASQQTLGKIFHELSLVYTVRQILFKTEPIKRYRNKIILMLIVLFIQNNLLLLRYTCYSDLILGIKRSRTEPNQMNADLISDQKLTNEWIMRWRVIDQLSGSRCSGWIWRILDIKRFEIIVANGLIRWSEFFMDNSFVIEVCNEH